MSSQKFVSTSNPHQYIQKEEGGYWIAYGIGVTRDNTHETAERIMNEMDEAYVQETARMSEKFWNTALPEPVTAIPRGIITPRYAYAGIYSMNRRQIKMYYTFLAKSVYGATAAAAMLKEHTRATKDDADDIEEYRVNTSSLMARYFWWI